MVKGKARVNDSADAERHAKRLAWRRQYYQRNRERLQEYNREWQRSNPDKVFEKVRKYQKTDKGKASIARIKQSEKYKNRMVDYRNQHNAIHRNWYYRNLQWARLISATKEARRRAAKLHAKGDASTEAVLFRMKFWGERCWVCKGPFDAIDHVFPLSNGGTNWPANLRPICRRCNAVKGAKHPRDFLKS